MYRLFLLDTFLLIVNKNIFIKALIKYFNSFFNFK